MIIGQDIIVRVIRRYTLPPRKNLYLVHDRTGKYALQLELTKEVNDNLNKVIGNRIRGFAYADIFTDPSTQELIIEIKRSAPDQDW